MEQSAIERLQDKSPEEAIIERISHDFNLAPFMARDRFWHRSGPSLSLSQRWYS